MARIDETKNELPLGIGKFGLGFMISAACLLSVIGFGIFAYYQQLTHGLIVTGLRTIGSGGASWGLYVAFDVVFVGVSFAGITIASLIRLLGIKDLKPIARIAELLTITSLLMGALVILADLGRPLDGLLKLPRLARPMSPFFGTFTMVIGGYLFASMVYFYLAGRSDAFYCAARAKRFAWVYRIWASGFKGTPAEYRRHHDVSYWMSLFILPLLVTAHSTLGFIFGIQAGRPGWFSTLQAPGFVVMAGISGIGMLIVITAIIRKTLHLEDTISEHAFRWLGNFVWILVLVYLYFIIAEELTISYAGGTKEREYTNALMFGPYAHLFWTAIGSLVLTFAILFIQFARGKVSIGWSVAAGLIVNVAAVLKRYLLVVPSQTHGMLIDYPPGKYSPSWVEISVILGLVALATFLYVLFVKVFPIVPVSEHEISETNPGVRSPRQGLRVALTAFCLLGGISLAVFGFAISARAFTKPYADPIIPFSPVLFIVGLMMTFYSGAVYETLPPEKGPPS